MIVTGPPFSAVGTTDRPFLARLTLEWAGSQNPAMDIEHWVEVRSISIYLALVGVERFVKLDALRAANPVLGDEQVVDVELDRNTTLYPIRKNHRQPAWELDGRDAYSTIPLEDKHLPSELSIIITDL
jgi:hypothetical protein